MKVLFAILFLLGSFVAKAQAPDIRYIVIHKAGKAWNPSQNMFEQPYILANPDPSKADQTHVNYYAGLLAKGKLSMGGPFPSSTGAVGAEVGMMVPAEGVSEVEIKRFAASDPAVQAGVLEFEVRPWLLGMKAP